MEVGITLGGMFQKLFKYWNMKGERGLFWFLAPGRPGTAPAPLQVQSQSGAGTMLKHHISLLPALILRDSLTNRLYAYSLSDTSYAITAQQHAPSHALIACPSSLLYWAWVPLLIWFP